MKLFAELTERQEEVLILVVQGLSNKGIAYKLNISVYTANRHLQDLLVGLKVKNRTEATNRYWQQLHQLQVASTNG